MTALLEYYFKVDVSDWDEDKIGEKFAKLAYVLERNSSMLNVDG